VHDLRCCVLMCMCGGADVCVFVCVCVCFALLCADVHVWGG